MPRSGLACKPATAGRGLEELFSPGCTRAGRRPGSFFANVSRLLRISTCERRPLALESEHLSIFNDNRRPAASLAIQNGFLTPECEGKCSSRPCLSKLQAPPNSPPPNIFCPCHQSAGGHNVINVVSCLSGSIAYPASAVAGKIPAMRLDPPEPITQLEKIHPATRRLPAC